MKKVKIANGIKRVDDSDTNTTLFRLRDILSEHRSILITRLLSDLGAYVDYKFKCKADARQLESLRDALLALRNSVLDLERYSHIMEHFLQNDMTYIGTEPFMQEIDEHISGVLNLTQLKLVG
jgi:hypothetical protein